MSCRPTLTLLSATLSFHEAKVEDEEEEEEEGPSDYDYENLQLN